MLERARETDLTRMMNFNNIWVIDPAFEPKAPIKPTPSVNLVVGALVGLVFGLGIALLREVTDRSVKGPSDVETSVGLTVIGVLISDIALAYLDPRIRLS